MATSDAIFRAWWPLAASWALMAVELPLVSAVVARLADPEVHLAAWGGVVFPVALIVEAPVIMMLAASTALTRDLASYHALRRFMHRLAGSLTIAHILVAFTPAYDLLIVRAMEVPAEVVEPGRFGLQIMTPWTWSIAYRRFNQGTLIRFGFSRAVGIGTAVRLLTAVAVLGIGTLSGKVSGIAVAAGAIAAGVLAEALYAGRRVRPVLRDMPVTDPASPPLRGRAFFDFYLPLAMTSVITLIVQPIAAAAVSRMPHPLESLAVWPVVSGLLFLLQSVGLSYSEVVVARLGRPGAVPALWRFGRTLSLATAATVVVIAGSSLSPWWFRDVSGLPPHLAAMAELALCLAIPVPPMRALQSWYQGVLVHVKRTRAITESVVVFLAVCCATLAFGIGLQIHDGIHVAVVGYALGRIAETGWLWTRSRTARRELAGTPPVT